MVQKNKAKQNKNIKQKQKQKQHQKQQVIVNVITHKSRNSTRKTQPSIKQESKKQTPLIQSLPLQYTPYTMYDTSRLIREENFNPNRQIFAPEIPNAINIEPIIQNAIPLGNVEEPIIQPAVVEVPQVFNREYDDVFTAEPEMSDRVFNRKTENAINASYPTPEEIWNSAKKRNPFPTPNDNSIQRLISNSLEDEYNINNFYGVLTPSREGENPLKQTRKLYHKTETTDAAADEESNLKTDKSNEEKYYCAVCESSVVNTISSINKHNHTDKHKKKLFKKKVIIDDDNI